MARLSSFAPLQEDTPRIAVEFRSVTLLDVPLIFELLHEGAVHGSFSNYYLRYTGSVQLLGMILHGVVGQYLQKRSSTRRYAWRIVTRADDHRQELGFLKQWEGVNAEGGLELELELLAVKPECRNRGIGTAVIAALTKRLQGESRLTVYCTKYARAMQHVLKRSQFRRNTRTGNLGLEHYTLSTSESLERTS